MTDPDQQATTTIAETKYLRLVERSGWSFVQRTTASRAVCIVACTTDDRLVLVEQFRPAVGKNVIELPAGLVGDLADRTDESLQQAAERELAEETGFTAGHWRELATLASCAGLTDEVTTLFWAGHLQRTGPGGGDASEDIRVHQVGLADVAQWLSLQSRQGKLVDARVYAAIFFCFRHADAR